MEGMKLGDSTAGERTECSPLDVAQSHLRWVWVTGRHLERKACQQRQIVHLVLIWISHLPQSTLMGDQIKWSKFSLEGEKAKSRLAPSILREIMSCPAGFVTRHTRRG